MEALRLILSSSLLTFFSRSNFLFKSDCLLKIAIYGLPLCCEQSFVVRAFLSLKLSSDYCYSYDAIKGTWLHSLEDFRLAKDKTAPTKRNFLTPIFMVTFHFFLRLQILIVCWTGRGRMRHWKPVNCLACLAEISVCKW